MRKKIQQSVSLLFTLLIAYFAVANIFALEKKKNDVSAPVTSNPLGSFVYSQKGEDEATRQNDDHEELDGRPHGLRNCTMFRIRSTSTAGKDATSSRSNNMTALLQKRPRIGLAFVEDPKTFVSLGKGKFHMYHFLEFLLISFAELDRVFAHSNASIAWVYAPLFTSDEICGVGKKGLNCQILELIFGKGIQLYGLDANDAATVALHPAFNGHMKERNDFLKNKESFLSRLFSSPSLLFGKREQNVMIPLPNTTMRERTHQEMVNGTDAILFVHRPSCKKQQRVNLQKMWTNYVGNFPAANWHQRVMEGIHANEDEHAVDSANISVCYIDRQATKRRMPDDYHNWLIQYIAHHPKMHLVHLHMEQFDPMEQIQIAASCQVMMGVHGNGLSHSLWMKPQSFVVEFFWNFPCRYDYATAAQLVDHHYLAIVNGHLLVDFETKISNIRSQSQVYLPTTRCVWAGQEKPGAKPQKVGNGTEALELFLQQAIHQAGIG